MIMNVNDAGYAIFYVNEPLVMKATCKKFRAEDLHRLCKFS